MAAMAPPSTRATPHRLPTRRFASWFLAGVLCALFLQFLQVRALGGDWTGLINTGETSNLRALIEAELGPVQTVERAGHDGQFSYLIARDLLGRGEAPDLFDHGAYRYRRILYPLLASGLGLFGPKATLVGLIAWAAVGMGLATAGLAAVAAALGARPWAVAGVIANPGGWLSVQLLTPDVLALGFALSGIGLWLRGSRRWAMVLLAAAALTKDQYLLVALGLAGWVWFESERRVATGIVAAAAAPLLTWSLWLTVSMGRGLTPRGNLALPLAGIVRSATRWADTTTDDLVFSLIALTALLAALALPAIAGSRLLRWLTWPWAGLAAISSTWVWDLGNNSLRVFAPLAVFAVLTWAALRVGNETR